ncbi:MAG: caspase family protein [Rhizobiaceae bacterium]|nr:caspase family protein [Rhizobiaceae bacterium]
MILFVLNTGAAHAAARLALVIGNSAYQNVAVLKNPKNDAAAMTKKLTSLGFDVVQGTDLDLNEMRRTVRDFIRKLSGAEMALFFYAGHGLQVNGKNYMAPIDATLNTYGDLEFEAVPIDLVLSAMERNTKTNMVFLDACRNNPLAVNLARSMGTRSAAVGRGLASIGSGVGTLVSFSTQPGNVALDGDGVNSPYTTALVAHLGTPGEDIAVSMKGVRRDVLSATGGKQVPWEHSSLTGDVILKAAPAIASKVVSVPANNASAIQSGAGSDKATELVFWGSVKDSTDPKAFEIYLRRYPTGVFSDLASVKLSAARRVQSGEARPRVSDSSTEIAYWKSIESGGSAVFFESYIARYPNGLFVDIANLKLAALNAKIAPDIKPDTGKTSKLASLSPKDGETPRSAIVEVPVINVKLDREGTRKVQKELNRLGCSLGSADGLWGKRSRRALTEYSKRSKAELASLEPTDGLLTILEKTKVRICPVAQRARSINKNASRTRSSSANTRSRSQRTVRQQPRDVVREERRFEDNSRFDREPEPRRRGVCLSCIGAVIGGIIAGKH